MFNLFRKSEGEFTLRLRRVIAACDDVDNVDTWLFEMVKGYKSVGYCDLRLGMNEAIYYAGQIGYHVYLPYRGHGYAYQACLIMFQIAKDQGLNELLITCSPDNMASRKTLEKLGGVLEATVDVPKWHWLYRKGEPVKQIYRFKL
ncbi:MAG: GNAT family N-acetyltransferase [Erysipelotrichaceae bacterium]|nr:GNAT family N-acetyltransferase [Erysipelotrichaceae bacterium]